MSYGAPPPSSGYGQPPYGGMPQQHGAATTALVLGILSFVACGPFTGIPAYIIGKRAEREILASNGALTGDGMAKAGWILGLVSIILTVLAVLGVIVLLVLGVAVSTTSGS